eukprot:TRINITY_DN16644_c1_g1_i1.p1 TRINITY_DN16644_c1_g1~~TRINITY_DN16644_c1_g1_i1.p1  ORF type:complete len:139 (+),score=48.28 TRINITY_DN16644_c1_g1_i1:274-690(+)
MMDIVKQEQVTPDKNDDRFRILWKDQSATEALHILKDKIKGIFHVEVFAVYLQNAVERVIQDSQISHTGASVVPKFLKAARKEPVVNSELSSVFDEFVCQADVLVRLIVSEFALDEQQKLIRPRNVGGVAGGQKYMSK